MKDNELSGKPLFKSDFSIKSNLLIESSPFTLFWNLIVTLILLFYMIFLPIEILSEHLWLGDNETYIKINLVFEWFFLVDIILNFITS